MKGVTVTLIYKTQTGKDEFGQPVYEEVSISVNDVLIGNMVDTKRISKKSKFI